MKNGGSLSTKVVLLSRTSLFDWSNQFSALLVSPELFFPPSASRLDGESVLGGCWAFPLSLENALLELVLEPRECSNDTDCSAGGLRGCTDGSGSGCGEVLTILGLVAALEVMFGSTCNHRPISSCPSELKALCLDPVTR